MIQNNYRTLGGSVISKDRAFCSHMGCVLLTGIVSSSVVRIKLNNQEHSTLLSMQKMLKKY